MKLNDFDNNNLLLSEKTFLPIDENTYILFPDFNKREPKILYFYKDRNSLEIKTYQSKPKLTQMLNKTKIISLRETIKDCKFVYCKASLNGGAVYWNRANGTTILILNIAD